MQGHGQRQVIVIPAEAGIQKIRDWIPIFMGMTDHMPIIRDIRDKFRMQKPDEVLAKLHQESARRGEPPTFLRKIRIVGAPHRWRDWFCERLGQFCILHSAFCIS